MTGGAKHRTEKAREAFPTAMKKDKRLGPEELYVAGSHLADRALAGGTDLLEEVIVCSPCSKLGKAAKNKLTLGR